MSLAHGKEDVCDAAKQRCCEIQQKEPAECGESTPTACAEKVNGDEDRPSEENERAEIVWHWMATLARVGKNPKRDAACEKKRAEHGCDRSNAAR